MVSAIGYAETGSGLRRDSGLTVAPLTDPAAINRILSDPHIAIKLTRDDGAPAYVDHPLLTYWGAYIGDDLVGLFIAVQFTRYEVEVHAALLRRAIRQSRELARLFLTEVFADQAVLRATAHAQSNLPSAINWIRKLGFAEEGKRRNATLVGGKPIDIVTLGLLRADAPSIATAGSA